MSGRHKQVGPRRVTIILRSMQPEVYYTGYELAARAKTLDELVERGLLLKAKQSDGVVRYKRVFRRPR